ncbi:hypothetical protein M3Y99_00053800 [Aphelenchoides fujianensis]|nr:hypothetical protein M3Y99_00053800 [Aphelenchoides fujianensis]
MADEQHREATHEEEEAPPILQRDAEIGVEDEMHPDANGEEMYEEITGEIMQGEHGTFLRRHGRGHRGHRRVLLLLSSFLLIRLLADLDTVNKIEVVVNADGTETVIFESGAGPLDEQQLMDEEKVPMHFADDHSHHHLDDPELEMGVMGADDDVGEGMYLHSHEDIKGRRNRVYGQAECPECRQSFVNTARLERHLSVHQSYGSFLCQLCGKTYKYEYNLFYHWRKTCRDLSELLDEERSARRSK